jgi:hypothetical protein
VQGTEVSAPHTLVGVRFFPKLLAKTNHRPERVIDLFLREIHFFELLALSL